MQIANDIARRGFVVGWDPLKLGNALSCVATLFTLSRRTGVPTIFPYADRYGELFPTVPKLSRVHVPRGLDEQALDRLLLRWDALLETVPHLAGVAGTRLADLGTTKVSGIVWASSLEGHLQDWSVDDAERKLRTFCRRGNGVLLQGSYWRQYCDMRSVAKHGDALRRHLGPVRAPASPMPAGDAHTLDIGLHMRLGDYRIWLDGRYFFEVDAYLAAAKRLHAELGERPHRFHLFSDQPVDPALFAGLPVADSGGDLFEDFARLSRCDLVVGPPSTFSTWAAFLGGKKRIVLTKERIAGDDALLPCAVAIPFPTGSYLPGDPRCAPI